MRQIFLMVLAMLGITRADAENRLAYGYSYFMLHVQWKLHKAPGRK